MESTASNDSVSSGWVRMLPWNHVTGASGNRARALAVLGETDKFAFSPEARKRFADLKSLYAAGSARGESQAERERGRLTRNQKE